MSAPRGKSNSPLRERLFTHLSASLLAVIFVMGLQQFPLDGLNGIFVDAQFRLRFTERAHPDIALIAYDDRSSNRYYGSTTIPAIEFANVFEALEQENPLAVAFIGSINEELYAPDELALIQESFLLIPDSIVGYTDDARFGKVRVRPALPEVKFLPGFVSRDTFSYGADSVSRRAMVTIGGLPTVYAEIARRYHGLSTPVQFKHVHRYGDGGPQQVYINWQGSAGTYPTFSTEQLTRRQFKPGSFTNKIVLIGSTQTAKENTDFVFTPYSRTPHETTTLEGAAHTLGTLLNNSGIYRSPTWLNWLVNLLVGVITVNVVLFFSPLTGILTVLAEIVVLFLLSFGSLIFLDCWVNFAHPFIIAGFGYYLVIPYRLVSEYRQRWHYQQKTEMMAQLEQLKTNFLSLVSHDLKTPIARIQGNAELLLSTVSPKDEKQKKSLSAIVHTTEGLSQHVETILDLTRIESAKTPLKLASKDINSTIMEVVSRKEALAEEKRIRIGTKLEPIFAFKFDVGLMRRVISNLVENAIKYSPEGSEIVLSTNESDDWIEISVSDQGAGIPEEDRERVFTKFYRCQNTETEKEKGTGLGLYLVKYFVELHRGFVKLNSEVGKGSTFTVGIPV